MKHKGTARAVIGYGGEKYALYKAGKRVGTSSMPASKERHEKELRSRGWRISKATVRE